MTVRKRDQYRREAHRDPFQLQLESGEVVTWADPKGLSTQSAFDMANTTDPYEICRILLGDDFEVFWAEWRDYPSGETDALIEDVMHHYGAGQGKPRSSRR